MSFIRPPRKELLERAARFRGELSSFLMLVTIWGVLLNVVASAVWERAGSHLIRVFDAWPWWAQWLSAVIAIVIGVWLALHWLARALAAELEDVQRFTLLVPMLVTEQLVNVLEVSGYRGPSALKLHFDVLSQERKLIDEYRRIRENEKTKGRPLQGNLYDTLAASLATEFVNSIRNANAFLLQNGLFHGREYFRHSPNQLATVAPRIVEPRVAALTSEVGGVLKSMSPIICPPRTYISVESSIPDMYGKSLPRILIRFPFGSTEVYIHSQCAIMSDGYHGRSLAILKRRLKGAPRRFSVCGDMPSLWALEFTCTVRTHFRTSLWKPWLPLAKEIEEYANWVDELIESLELEWSWESYLEINSLSQSNDDDDSTS